MNTVPADLAPVVDGKRRVICCHSATLSGRFPPNSLAAVEECIVAGVPRFEIDVRFLGDDAIAVFHDGDLAGRTTGAGKLDELARDKVATARYRSDETYGICFLEDVVERVRESQSQLQVDLKLMRPMTADRAKLLQRALQPIRDQVIVGSQAHWNLRALQGLPVAFDPSLQWRYEPGRSGRGTPRSTGVHGLWDDSPLADVPHASAEDYLRARIADLRGILPEAVEWMVDIETVLYIASLGFSLGAELEAEGCDLAAWTLHGDRPGRKETLHRLFSAGAAVVISGAPLVVADDVASSPP